MTCSRSTEAVLRWEQAVASASAGALSKEARSRAVLELASRHRAEAAVLSAQCDRWTAEAKRYCREDDPNYRQSVRQLRHDFELQLANYEAEWEFTRPDLAWQGE